jgi:hypothetical protein
MYKEITNKDITDGKIYLHAVTFLADVLYKIVIDDNLFNQAEAESDHYDATRFCNFCEFYVNIFARNLGLSKYLYTEEQEEYIKRFARVIIGFIFGDEETLWEIRYNRKKYKENYQAFGEYIMEHGLPLLREFDKLWTKGEGKIREDTPYLRRKGGKINV